MSWEAGLKLRGSTSRIALSATDIASDCACGRFLALKARPQVKSAEWERSFAPWGAIPFPLGDIRDLIDDALRLDPAPAPADLPGWIRGAVETRGVHRLLQKFIAEAVENGLDAHYDMEESVGELNLIAVDPSYGSGSRTLKVWAPLYETTNGVREIRRYRLGPARQDHTPPDTHWSTTAGFIAAKFCSSITPTRVRVVEIGLLDGSTYVCMDVPPQAAVDAYVADTRTHAASIIDAAHVVPCRSCSECKIAGICTDLIPMPSVIGQPSRGVSTRSVSASELSEYDQCPGRWLLNRHLHLPKEKAVTHDQDRGLSVHRWLARAHARGVQCTSADILQSSGGRGLAEGVLSAEQFAVVEPFLVQHLAACPFGQPEYSLVAAEETVYGFDSDADVVTILKPDLVYRQGNRLIVRETKTSLEIKIQSSDEAYDKYLQVPFSLQALRKGLLERYGAEVGVVELELLSPVDHHVWRWDTTHSQLAAVAAGDVRRAAEDWHSDLTWETRPGAQCEWCPVRQWCPDSDIYSLGLMNTGTGSAAPPGSDPVPF